MSFYDQTLSGRDAQLIRLLKNNTQHIVKFNVACIFRPPKISTLRPCL